RGLPTVGIDASPVAVAIAQAKLVQVTSDEVVAEAERILAGPEPANVPEGSSGTSPSTPAPWRTSAGCGRRCCATVDVLDVIARRARYSFSALLHPARGASSWSTAGAWRHPGRGRDTGGWDNSTLSKGIHTIAASRYWEQVCAVTTRCHCLVLCSRRTPA
ncbi:MAG: hypothetical protein AB2385_16075, partial [Symbiobacterium sp.]